MERTIAITSPPDQGLAIPRSHRFLLEQAGFVLARLALGSAFLSAVASRFGIWTHDVGLGHFALFMHYAAEVNSFMPASTIPLLAWTATAAECFLGVALVAGFKVRWVAFGSATLLGLFGLAMALSFGVKSPMDYSVFSASAAALLLATHYPGRERDYSSKR